jgi:membrane protease YdiL (CAAX protease family)
VEEYLFRHLVQKVILLKLFPSARKFTPTRKYILFSIIITALFFAIIHFKFYPELALWTLYSGLIYGLSYYYTNSITVSWILHVINNYLSFVL